MNINRYVINNKALWRGLFSILFLLLLWESYIHIKTALGGKTEMPIPSTILSQWSVIILDGSYWASWYASYTRVLAGFCIAMLIGIPFGLALAVNRNLYSFFFPIFEILRPIPPLAWVPASLIFWPTQEMSIIFVIFLGAFYAVVINVLGGARNVDIRYLRAAQSMGANRWQLFWRVILPATLPSIFTGAAVGMGITWEVVVAAEMIAVGGRVYGGGLGFFVWNSFVGGSTEQAVIGMLSIGIAGFIASSLLRAMGRYLTPWHTRMA
ncbi:ABC transporter permease [Candidatus Albibeggiatoa sp. nov. BB20]|uniref:ABC transporter permease n=1 Tax=Candidatus Albibeggiatoa sp. nov. BB20 TaxID=3162723 RepID=UPI0033659E8C